MLEVKYSGSEINPDEKLMHAHPGQQSVQVQEASSKSTFRDVRVYVDIVRMHDRDSFLFCFGERTVIYLEYDPVINPESSTRLSVLDKWRVR